MDINLIAFVLMWLTLVFLIYQSIKINEQIDLFKKQLEIYKSEVSISIKENNIKRTLKYVEKLKDPENVNLIIKSFRERLEKTPEMKTDGNSFQKAMNEDSKFEYAVLELLRAFTSLGAMWKSNLVDRNMVYGELGVWIVIFYSEMEPWIIANRKGTLKNSKYNANDKDSKEFLNPNNSFALTWEEMKSEIVQSYEKEIRA